MFPPNTRDPAGAPLKGEVKDFILSGFCKLLSELILFFSTSFAKLSISPQRIKMLFVGHYECVSLRFFAVKLAMKSFPYSHFINSIDCLLRQYLKI